MGGTSRAQRGIAYGQRSRKAQPLPSSQIDGTTPRISFRSWRVPSRLLPSSGRQAISPCVYGCSGAPSTCSVVPCSITRPAYITITRSAISATAPMSCVISTMAVPRSRCSSRSRSKICACTVTSSAVVGSSAIRMSGRQASAIAIITRWRMPPDILCGWSSTRRSGAGMPTWRSISMARSRAARRSSPACTRSDSPIWSPTVYTGFSEVIGSWKIIEMRLPRTSPMRASLACTRSSPRNSTRPARMRPGGEGMRRSSASAVMLLPQPDSPTTHSVSPGLTSKSTPLSTSAVPRRVRNST